MPGLQHCTAGKEALLLLSAWPPRTAKQSAPTVHRVTAVLSTENCLTENLESFMGVSWKMFFSPSFNMHTELKRTLGLIIFQNRPKNIGSIDGCSYNWCPIVGNECKWIKVVLLVVAEKEENWGWNFIHFMSQGFSCWQQCLLCLPLVPTTLHYHYRTTHLNYDFLMWVPFCSPQDLLRLDPKS